MSAVEKKNHGNPNPPTAQIEPYKFGPGEGGGGLKARTLHRHVRDMVNNDPKLILSVLFGIANDPRARDADRLAAARELLDRGWGRPVSMVVVEDSGENSNLDLAITELLDEIRGTRQAADPPVLEAAPSLDSE